ncbi:hypothetical protein D0T53_07430 [Dysgonomonas sp. 216]|uniref:hypothetical protein n=1 Tax=Dysgonomonas sp. 216 TaxID=2302934 RepID=UPI0013D475BB|nr:hypothetical protein [Dysgonomonas sp. 216]NDW18744.1 hypothetical protein [Dysgonomonas sp. 216]
MKIVNHTIKSLLLAAMLFPATFTALHAQVTIGSGIEPTKAALLELKTQQTAGAVPSVIDDANITSTTGGLLLPRVKLVNVNTMQPFIADDNADWVANTNSIKEKLAGLMVYNLTNDGTFYPGVYTWDGATWMTSEANPAVSSITGQPKAFTFYESGEGTADALEFIVNGPGTWTYKWYQVTGNNIHVRIGKPVGEAGTIYTTAASANAAGANTSKFKPQAILKGTTRNANNTGFYKFYCIAESDQGAKLTSETAEVAVGCGAKDNLGEWVSFMCFNLGATEQTIAGQIGHPMTFSHANDTDGKHYYIANEEQVYGDLYQWGRIGDGHEKRGQAQGFKPGANTAGTNQVAYGTGPTFEDGEILGTSQRYPWRQVARSTTHYGNFILTGSAQNYNWAFSLPANQIDQIWRTSRFAPNDPCAKINVDGTTYTTYYPAASSSTAGGAATTNWRMPSQDEWGSIFKGGGITGARTTATANTWEWNSSNGRGMEIKPDGETTTLFLPASGYRYGGNGLLYHQGSSGRYWSSNILSTNAYYLNFYSGTVNPAYSNARGLGFALRCIKN